VGQGRKLPITEEAFHIYDNWYMNLEPSVHNKRLDTYALRLMGLLAVNELKPQVDASIIEKTLALCKWQLAARQLHDPIGADNEIATMEEKIRRILKSKGGLKDWELRQLCNVRSKGLWTYQTAKKNLMGAREIQVKNKVFSLTS